MIYIYYSLFLFRCFPSNKCWSINVCSTNRREKQMNDNVFFFCCLVQKRCGKKYNTVYFCLSPPPPPQAKRCNAGPEEETLQQQELQRSDAGTNGEKMQNWRCWKLPCWAAAGTRSSPSPSLCRCWKRAWKTAATGFTSKWPTGTSWMECWWKSSPPRITLQQSSRTKCSRSYRSDSASESVIITMAVNLIRYVRLCVCCVAGLGRRLPKQPRSDRCGPHLRGT